MTSKRQSLACPEPSSAEPPPSIKTLNVNDSSNANCLYEQAYAAACRAVKHDRLGEFEKAKNEYKRVIELFNQLLQVGSTDHRVQRDQLLQKLNEYAHRKGQLERYSTGAVEPESAHPDAEQHLLYNNQWRVDQNIRDTRQEYKYGEEYTDSDEEEEDDDEEAAEIRLYLAKAHFSMIQGDRNDAKGYIEQALEYYKDAASCYKMVYEALSSNPSKRAYARNKCLEALDKAEEMKALDKQQKNQMTLLAVKHERTHSRELSRPAMGRNRASSTSSTRSAKSVASVASQLEGLSVNGKTAQGDSLASQRLLTRELEVLKHTSNVNNKLFLPWIDDTDLKEYFSFEKRFVDPEGSLRLSPKQIANFGGWKRPSEIMKNPKLIHLISSTSLVQDIVTDCSFVASLCVAAAYERKFKKQLITSCIYPQDKYGQPCYNPNGKYVIKLLHNGIQRKIVVDDLLPVSREGTLMCTFSTNKEELWASIIEKAYMKLMGGYDFPGSNSGIDLYSLTGWIPEHIFIQDTHFVANNVWDRIQDGAKYGDVLVTIATGDLADDEADSLGLVPTHAYAVIDIKCVLGKRFMQVKNPWSHKRWRGPYSHLDTESWTPELMGALNYDPSVAGKKDDGIFWIDYESVCKHFASIHLNWNPETFSHRWVLHSSWPENIGPKRDIYNLGYNPQFSLHVNVPDKKPAAVWLLLSKHVMVTEENTDYITLHIYNNTDGKRVYYPEDTFKEGTYVNSPHILVRFNAPPGPSSYTIVASQHEKAQNLYFSLRAWSQAPFKLSEVPMRYCIEKKLLGQWTEHTAGGNASNASYMHNPQWKITIPASSPTGTKTEAGLLLMLEAPKSLAVHLSLMEGGKRVTTVSVRDIVAQSGPYRPGFCYCELEDIKPGSYTVVASTFEVDLLGQFILTVASNIEVDVESIPPEGAGMFRKVIHGEWIRGYSAMGCPSYGHYGNNPRYLLEIRELTTVKVRLQANKIDPVPSINVNIYEKHPTELFGKEVATSGPYTNVIQGVATNDVVLSQNQTGYIIVVATHEKDIEGAFTMTVYSDRPVSVRNDR